MRGGAAPDSGEIAGVRDARRTKLLTFAGLGGHLGSVDSDPDQRDAGAIDAYLQHMVRMGASDLFLRADTPPVCRVDGGIVRTDMPAPDAETMRRCMQGVLTPLARDRFAQSPDLDVAYTSDTLGRFRINVFLHQGRLGLVARAIPPGALDFEALNLPTSIRAMADAASGLVLVVGPTGCGKSTTLAAMIHHVNATRRGHIVTIEDPIEFVHDEIECLIHQRQVGSDTESFATALRHVVRQSPDVIMIGEMRDRDTMQTALSAALTGHLVLTTLHTANVVQCVDRMLGYFPPEARSQVRTDLASTLVGIVAMRLLPRADGQGRLPAVEVLRGTPTVRRLLAEGEMIELYDVMKRGADTGMATMNQSLVALCNSGHVDRAVAQANATNVSEFNLNMQGMFTGIDSIDLRTTDRTDGKEP